MPKAGYWLSAPRSAPITPLSNKDSGHGAKRAFAHHSILDEHDESFLLLQMLGKEREAAWPGDIGAGLVIARPLIAVEALLRAGIDMDLDIGPLGANRLDVAERDAGVLFAEMQLGRHFRLVVGEANNGATVIANRRREA